MATFLESDVSIKRPQFIAMHLDGNCDRDMFGRYFVQLTGNEQQLVKLDRINNGNPGFALNWDKRYSLDEIRMLRLFTDIFDSLAEKADRVQFLVLEGRLDVPGKNESYGSGDKLNEWWDKHFESAKCPNWSKMYENVYDLASGGSYPFLN